MTTIIRFESYDPVFQPDAQSLDPQFVQQCNTLIMNLVQFSRVGFCFAACDQIIISGDVKRTHLSQANQLLQQQISKFKSLMTGYKFVQGIPLVILCEILNAINNFQPPVIAYILTVLFPELNMQMEKIVEVLSSNQNHLNQYKNQFNQLGMAQFLKISPMCQVQQAYSAIGDNKSYVTDINLKLANAQCMICYQISPQIYVNALNLCDNYLQDVVSMLRRVDYQIIDIYNGIGGQIPCESIKTSLMALLLSYQNTYKTISSYEALLLNQSLQLDTETDNKASLPQQDQQSFKKHVMPELSQCHQINSCPLVVSVDDRFEENTINFLSVCLTLTSKCPLQIIEGNSFLSTFDVSSICYTVSNSYRTFVFQYPELLKSSSFWWLLWNIPNRYVDNNSKMKPNIFKGYHAVRQLISDSYTMPIRGKLVFVTKLVKRLSQKCNCVCQNVSCPNNMDEIDLDDIQYTQTIQYKPLHQQFINSSINVDFLCQLGACCHGNEIKFQNKIIENIQKQNTQIIAYIKNQYVKNEIIHPGQLKSEIQIADLLISKLDQSLIPTQALRIQGYFLIVQPGVGMVNYSLADGVAICFSLSNTKSYASSLHLVYCISNNNQLYNKARLLFYGKLISNTNISQVTSQQHLVKNVIGTKIAQIYLFANPICYNNLEQLLFQQITDIKQQLTLDPKHQQLKSQNNQYQHIIKRKNHVNIPMLIVYNIFNQMYFDSFNQLENIILTSNILFTVQFQILFNNVVNKAYLDIKNQLQFITLFTQLIQPLIDENYSNDYENIQKLQVLFSLADQYQLLSNQYCLNDCLNISLNSKTPLLQKGKILCDINSQSTIQYISKAKLEQNSFVPDFLLNLENEYSSNYIQLIGKQCDIEFNEKINTHFQLQILNYIFKKHYQNVNNIQTKEQNEKIENILLNQLKIDNLLPYELTNLQAIYENHKNHNILSILLVGKVLQNSDLIFQSYDFVMRLYLSIIGKNQFKEEKSNRTYNKSSMYYDLFQNRYIIFENSKVQTYLQLFSCICDEIQKTVLVPMKPSDLYIYRHSDKSVTHAKDFLLQFPNAQNYQIDLFTALPDINGISLNQQNVINIYQIQHSDYFSVFRKIYGTLYCDLLVPSVIQVLESNKQLFLQYSFLNLDQVKDVIYKQIGGKVFQDYQKHPNEQLQRLSGNYLKFVQISGLDVCLQINKPIIVQSKLQISNEDFTFLQGSYSTNRNVFDIIYMQIKFMPYFNYLLNIDIHKQFSQEQQSLYSSMFKNLTQTNALQFDTINRILISWCQLARQSVLVQYNQLQQKIQDSLYDQIVSGFYYLLCIIFNITKEDEFSPLYGIMLQFAIEKLFGNLITKSEIEVLAEQLDYLMTPQYYKFCQWFLAIFLCIVCNIQLIFCNINDIDFISDCFNMYFNKHVFENSQMCSSCEQKANIIEESLFYADFFDKYKQLINTSNIKHQIDIYCLKNNGNVCEKCLKEIMKQQIYQQCVLLTPFNPSELQIAVLPDSFNSMQLTINQIKTIKAFIKKYDNNITSNLVCQLFKESNIDIKMKIIAELHNISKSGLSIEDNFQILTQLNQLTRKTQNCNNSNINNLIIQRRNHALISKLPSDQMFNLIVQLVRNNQSNDTFLHACDKICKINQINVYECSLLQIRLLQQNGQCFFKVRNIISSDNRMISGIIGAESVVQNIQQFVSQHQGDFSIISYSFTEMINIIKQKCFWTQEIAQNNGVSVIQGSRINIVFIDEQQKSNQQLIVNEMYQSLKIYDAQWEIIANIQNISDAHFNYLIFDSNTNCLENTVNTLLQFTQNKAYIIVFAKCTLTQTILLKFYHDVCFYVTSANQYQFKESQKLIQSKITKWLIKDTYYWNQLQFTQAHLFSTTQPETKQVKQQAQQLQTNQQQLCIITKLQDNCKQLINNSFDLDQMLFYKFTKSCIEHFIQLIQMVLANNDIQTWKNFYGPEQYISVTDDSVLTQIMQIDQTKLKLISKKFQQYHNINIRRIQYQPQQPNIALKPLISSLDRPLHSFLTQFLQTKQNDNKSIINNNQLKFYSTNMPPQYLPIDNFSFIISQILSEIENDDQIDKIFDKYYANDIDNKDFNVYLYIFFNVARVYEFSQIIQFIQENKQDQRLDLVKLQQLADLCMSFLTKVATKFTQNENISQKQLLIFSFQNSAFCVFISQLFNSMFKSDLLHYLQSYLFTQVQMCDTIQQLRDKIEKQTQQFAVDCFSKDLSYCAFYIQYYIQRTQLYNYQFFLVATYFFILYKYDQQMQLEHTCSAAKDSTVISQFKSIYQTISQNCFDNNSASVILDIFSTNYVMNNKYIVNQLVKLFFCFGKFSKNDEIAVKEFNWLMEQTHLQDKAAIIYQFKKQRPDIEIFDNLTILHQQIKDTMVITNLAQYQQILSQYQAFATKNASTMSHESSQNVVQQLLQLVKQQSKLPLAYNIELVNQNIPSQLDKLIEKVTDAQLYKQFQVAVETVIATILVQQILNNGDILYIKQYLTKYNDQIQYIFYEQLKNSTNPQQSSQIISENNQIQTIFSQIYLINKQNQINQQSQEIPKYCFCHFNNSPQYYDQKLNRQYSNLIDISGQAQQYMLMDQSEGKKANISFIKQIEDMGGRFIDNLRRIEVIKQFNSTDQLFKYFLIATESFLLDVGPNKSFHQLLADNHDECLGLWMPGHVFESRLGIVHADCGLKDSRFEQMAPESVNVRMMSPLATRLTWILTFSCIYLSLQCNPNTQETPQEESLLSSAENLYAPRQQYCTGVVQTCVAIVQQLKQCYSYEVLILYQQFLINYSGLLKKQQLQLQAPRQAESRDQIEQILEQSANIAETMLYDVIRRNSPQQTIHVYKNTVKLSAELSEKTLLNYLNMSQMPQNIANIVNATGYAIVLQKRLRKCVSLKLCEYQSYISSKMDAKYEYLAKTINYYTKFREFYNQCHEILTIGGGCQDTVLPRLEEEVCVAQLVCMSDYSDSANDLAVVDELVAAGL